MQKRIFLFLVLVITLCLAIVGCKKEERKSNDISTDTIVEKTIDKNLTQVVNSITKILDVKVPIQDYISAQRVTNYLGISGDFYHDNIESAIYYKSAISPVNEFISILKVKDISSVELVKSSLLDNFAQSNQLKDKEEYTLSVLDSEEYILLVASSKEECELVIIEFSKYFNGNVGTTLSKDISSINS